MTDPPDTFEFEVVAPDRSGLVAEAERKAAAFFGADGPLSIEVGTARAYTETATGVVISYRADCMARVAQS